VPNQALDFFLAFVDFHQQLSHLSAYIDVKSFDVEGLSIDNAFHHHTKHVGVFQTRNRGLLLLRF